MKIRIALDGPGGSGKSTMGKRLAKQYGFTYVDTGAMYRATALYFDRNDIVPESLDDDQCARVMDDIHVSFAWADDDQRVFLNGSDVSAAIRTSRNSLLTSRVAKLPVVRRALVAQQQAMARQQSVVMDGRDIASVVIPDAELKIYLEASPEVRAQRRMEELEAKGESLPFEKVLQEIHQRDHEDMNREHSPLVKVAEAIEVDTSSMDADMVFRTLCDYVDALLREQSAVETGG
ncbi:(d)CMP kinase [Desulfurispirillum indicum]|uniref:(d)CMP kinase n=1 Tax=Desulfurispirillum indicum TaxID=936456 RepID=UPI001CFA6D02|nr:(d)CMP kinase [Desulfurispirillum indicum]UCZ57389.1 (d)CMP kinase [Desulfurispirillum indicum]